MSDNQNQDVARAVELALSKHYDKVKGIIDQVDSDLKTYKSVQDSTKTLVEKANTDGQKLYGELKEANDKQAARVLDLEQKLANARLPGGGTDKAKSIGEQFTESKEFLDFLPAGKMSGKHSMQSPFRTKNTITSGSGSAGPGIFPEYLPTPVIPPFMPLTIRDLVATGTTDSNMIIWVQENMFTNNAGYQGSEGALKPQSDITYTQKNVAVETIGHWIKASKQVLSDFKQLQSLINARLTWGLKYAEEQQILYGDGASGHLHGLVPQATTYNGGYASSDTKIDTIRRAMLQTTLAFYPATGVAMSPYDWADIQLTKDSQNRYIWANPMQNGPGMLWGLPIAECFSMQRGDFLVGSFKLAVTLFDREEASILISTEDQDNFVRNLVTILAEERLALAVSRPAAIIYGNFKQGETG